MYISCLIFLYRLDEECCLKYLICANEFSAFTPEMKRKEAIYCTFKVFEKKKSYLLSVILSSFASYNFLSRRVIFSHV